MSSTGISITTFITCLSAAKLFSYNKQSNTYLQFTKTFAIIGSFVSFIFLALLLVRVLPASTGYTVLYCITWMVIIGLIFFVIRHLRIEKYG